VSLPLHKRVALYIGAMGIGWGVAQINKPIYIDTIFELERRFVTAPRFMYTIKPGDTYTRLARCEGVAPKMVNDYVRIVKQLNAPALAPALPPAQEENNEKLYSGQKIRLLDLDGTNKPGCP